MCYYIIFISYIKNNKTAQMRQYIDAATASDPVMLNNTLQSTATAGAGKKKYYNIDNMYFMKCAEAKCKYNGLHTDLKVEVTALTARCKYSEKHIKNLNSHIKKLEGKIVELENAVKYLPIVSGEYQEAHKDFISKKLK